MNETDKLSTNDLILALEARKKTLSTAEKARLSSLAAVTETRGDVGSTVEGGRTATLSAEAADTALEKLARLSQVIANQYGEWAKGVEGSKFSPEQVQASFSPEQLDVASTYATPFLLMMPVTKKDSGEITGYEPFIAEGKQEMYPYTGDNVRLALQNRIAARKQARREDESGMTRALYDPLFDAAKKAGKPIDRQFYTMLEDDFSEGDPDVPVADSYDGRPHFRGDRADFPYDRARFRSTVRGNVLSI